MPTGTVARVASGRVRGGGAPDARDPSAPGVQADACPELPRRYVDRPRLTGAARRTARAISSRWSARRPGWGKTVLLSAWAAAQPPGRCAWLTLEPGDARCSGSTSSPRCARGGWSTGARFAADDDGRRRRRHAGPAGRLVRRAGRPGGVGDRRLPRADRPGRPRTRWSLLVRHAGGPAAHPCSARAPTRRCRCTGGGSDGVLGEVRGADLSFTLGETEALLAAHRVRVSEPALAELQTVSEGWAASLRLAALSMEGSPEPERVAAEFATHDRVLSDYLLSEVLDRLPEDARDVLLRTSLLDEVNPALVAALTGRADGARVLAGLERANALVARRSRPGRLVPLPPAAGPDPAQRAAAPAGRHGRRPAPAGLRLVHPQRPAGRGDPARAGRRGVVARGRRAHRALAGRRPGRPPAHPGRAGGGARPIWSGPTRGWRWRSPPTGWTPTTGSARARSSGSPTG